MNLFPPKFSIVNFHCLPTKDITSILDLCALDDDDEDEDQDQDDDNEDDDDDMMVVVNVF